MGDGGLLAFFLSHSRGFGESVETVGIMVDVISRRNI
jgi:hypothetical protein